MALLSRRLSEGGFATFNLSYPARRHRVAALAEAHVAPALVARYGEDAGPIHFVTHSLGGIIVRQLAASGAPIDIGRVVMLAPPNRGSELVDALGDWAAFRALNGPAGRQLGTARDSLPNALGPAPFEAGVIAGNRSINVLLSSLIEGADDGKVSVDNTKLVGMRDFLVVRATHPLIMRKREVADQAAHFLRHGVFRHARV